MSSKSKTKGSTWERDVAKLLSDVFNENFMRVPNSGAYTGGTNIYRESTLTDKQKQMMSGDIFVADCMDNFKIECKAYKDFPFHQLFTKCKLLDTWIEQAESETLHWLLCIKINNKGKYVCFHKQYRPQLKITPYITYDNKFIITELDGFFETNKDTILEINKKTPLHY
jgi:hypothetical protein